MLADYITKRLAAVFVGTSVATASATQGHYYSGPGNKFWELLWEAGLTGDSLLMPEQDATILEYGLGLTDLVKGRAASSDALLEESDYDVSAFVSKVESFEPFAVAFNGTKAARKVFRFLRQPEPSLGLSSTRIKTSLLVVLPSSSGANANPRNFAPKSSKAEWWREFGALLRASGRLPTP